MHPLALDGTFRIIIAAILGIFFGFMLIKTGLSNRKTFLDLAVLKDVTVVKLFFFFAAIGTFIYYFCHNWGILGMHANTTHFWAAAAGGIICSIGILISGLFPESALASIATGRVYAIWTLIGMLLAIPTAKWMSSTLSSTVHSWGAPFTFHDTLNGYFTSGFSVLWLPLAFIIITIFIQFTARGGGDDKGKK